MGSHQSHGGSPEGSSPVSVYRLSQNRPRQPLRFVGSEPHFQLRAGVAQECCDQLLLALAAHCTLCPLTAFCCPGPGEQPRSAESQEARSENCGAQRMGWGALQPHCAPPNLETSGANSVHKPVCVLCAPCCVQEHLSPHLSCVCLCATVYATVCVPVCASMCLCVCPVYLCVCPRVFLCMYM